MLLDASRRSRTRSIRFEHFKISISLRMALTGGKVWETSLVLSVNYSLTMKNFSRKENLQDRLERNLLVVSQPMPLMVNKLWDQLCQPAQPVGNMVVLEAKIWINLGITTQTSLVQLMIPTYQRTTTSKLLRPLRHSQRVAAQLQLQLQKQSINRNPRKREPRRNLHLTLRLIHLRQMKRVIRRKRRRLQRLA